MIRLSTRLAPGLLGAAAGFALFAGAAPAFADVIEAPAREFCADRPGKGSPTCTLEPGAFQLEGGFGYARHDEGGVRAEEFDYGALTFRWGLTERMEGQILWSPYVVDRVKIGGVTFQEEGSGDVAFSLRHGLTDPDGEGPSMALQVIVSAPTGSDHISADVWEGSVMLPMAFEVGENTELSLMPQIDIVGDAAGGGHHTAIAGVIGVEHGMGDLTFAAELWARRDDDPLGEVTEASVGFQLMWTPSTMDDVQFDIGVDIGLNEDTPDLEFGAGIAKRF